MSSRSIDKFGLNAAELGKASFPYIHGVIGMYTDEDNAVIYMDSKEPFLQPLLCADETGAARITTWGQGSAPANNMTPKSSILRLPTSQTCDRRLYLNTPFNDKEEAKSLGAIYHNSMRKWYIPQGKSLEKFNK